MISNHAPSASRTTLQSERSSLLFSQIENSGSRTRTYDIMINSHALLPTELCRNNTSVATSYSHKGQPLTTIGAKKLNFCVRHGYRCILLAIATTLWCYLIEFAFAHSKLDLKQSQLYRVFFFYHSWLSPRSISISPLHTSLYFHF